MFRSLVEKSLVLALLIVIHDAYYLGKTRIVYPHVLEARSSESSVSLFINDEITLNLERADIFPEMFLLQYSEGETEVKKYIKGADLNNLVYHDRDQKSAVSIERDDGLYVNGIIHDTYRIKPYPMERSDTGIIAHELVQVEEPHSTLHGDYFAEPLQDHMDLLTPKSAKLPPAVYPEVLVMADINIQQTVDPNLTLEVYVALLLASANVRFLSIRQTRLSLKLCSVSVMTGDQQNNIYHIVKDGDVDYVEANGTLYNLALEVQGASYKDYDMVVLVTERKVALRIGTRLVEETDGYAFVGGSCSDKKVAVMEHGGLGLVGASTFAHETAHLLGSPHDEEGPPPNIQGAPGAMSCLRSEGYLMGDLYSDRTDKRKYGLSACSIRSIVHFLGLPTSECLKTKNLRKYVTSSELPGSIITPNQTCEHFLQQLNVNNGFHDTTDSGLKQCDLKCTTPVDGGSYLFVNTEALDGTICGASKICRQGKCKKKQ